jgi:tetraacyldisaccharide 4'-kinase
MISIKQIPETILKKIVDLRNNRFDSGKAESHEVSKPVISIGNLSFGGSGKTPLTIAIAEELIARGFKPAVIGRGYKRSDKSLSIISSGDRILTGWKTAGDEMYLIAKKLPVPVIVNEKKYRAAEIAGSLNVDCILLDDGFQHRQLHRDIDIAIVDRNTIDNPFLSPRGHLREPIGNIRRADFIFAHEGLILTSIENLIINKIIIRYKTVICEPVNFFGSKNFVYGNEVIAFSGIANESRFRVSLEAKNISLNQHLRYKDHYAYKSSDIEKIIERAKFTGTNQIITTEKDAVKLDEFSQLFSNSNIELFVLPIKITITHNKELFFSNLETQIRNQS